MDTDSPFQAPTGPRAASRLYLQRAGRVRDVHGFAAGAEVVQGKVLPRALQQLQDSGTGDLRDNGGRKECERARSVFVHARGATIARSRSGTRVSRACTRLAVASRAQTPQQAAGDDDGVRFLLQQPVGLQRKTTGSRV
jgi:hypothetical protein